MAVDPHLIPGFEIVGRLASGGLAQVFRARREKDDLLVALKVTSLADLDPEFQPVERFTREAKLLSRLNHPALPRLFGYGVTPDAYGWIALELVSGKPLSAFSAHPVNELVPVFIQIAEALQTVAQEGVVHRDVAPDNVLVETKGSRLVARLIDLGAAKDLLVTDAAALTRHGAFLGKIAYASPEQLVGAGKGETLDFRSDIYSLGMTMYEVLAGRPAIQKTALAEVVEAHLKALYPPLVVAPERGGPAPRLEALVARMIARRREDRPASWEEVLAELWRSREEVSPLAEALAKKREDAGLAPEPRRPPPLERPEPRRAASSREVVVGRVVLALGALAFLGALVFAIVYVRAHRPAVVAQASRAPEPVRRPAPAPRPTPASAPEPTPSPILIPTESAFAPPPTAVPPTRAAPPTKRTAPRPRPTAAPEAANGVLEIALAPGGDLEEALDDAGRTVASRLHLPARLELPPGRYRLHLAAPAVDCAKSVTVLVRAGKTTSVRETCIEIK